MTDQAIRQIVYPCCGYQSRKGVLIGYHQNSRTDLQPAIAMGQRTASERVSFALEQGVRIHPQYSAERNRVLGRLAERQVLAGRMGDLDRRRSAPSGKRGWASLCVHGS